MTFLTFIYNLIFYLFDICLLDFKFAVGYWEFVCEGGGGYTCQKKGLHGKLKSQMRQILQVVIIVFLFVCLTLMASKANA